MTFFACYHTQRPLLHLQPFPALKSSARAAAAKSTVNNGRPDGTNRDKYGLFGLGFSNLAVQLQVTGTRRGAASEVVMKTMGRSRQREQGSDVICSAQIQTCGWVRRLNTAPGSRRSGKTSENVIRWTEAQNKDICRTSNFFNTGVKSLGSAVKCSLI